MSGNALFQLVLYVGVLLPIKPLASTCSRVRTLFEPFEGD